jgi:hypothetical protein
MSVLKKVNRLARIYNNKKNTNPSNSEDIRFGFIATLRCLEAAVFPLMNVLKAHSQRSVEKYTNKSVI